MFLFTSWTLLLIAIAAPTYGIIEDIKVSQTMYMTAVADVINEEFARLGAEVEEFSPLMTKCTKALNASSDACQSCLKTVDCGGGSGDTGGSGGGGSGDGGFKPKDLIHLVNPIHFLKEPLDNIISKLGSATGKFGKAVGKHLIKGLESITGGFAKPLVGGLKASLKGLKKLGSHLGKAIKGITGSVGKISKSVGKALKGAVKAVGKGVKNVFKGVGHGVKKAVKFVGKGVKHVFRGVGRGVKSAAKAIGRGAKSVWRGIKSLFGRRRRSAPTPEEKACMSKCPDCRPFMSGKETDAIKHVCGKDIILRNATLTAEVALIDEFFNDVNAAELDLIQEIKVNTTSGLLIRVNALIRGQYRSFSTNVAFNAFDHEAVYKNLAKYIYTNYLRL